MLGTSILVKGPELELSSDIKLYFYLTGALGAINKLFFVRRIYASCGRSLLF